MPRQFSLMQMIMAILLVAILLCFYQTEGGGRRHEMIETLAYNSDGSKLLVAKLACRDADAPGKAYRDSLSRTISWIRSDSGICAETIQRDFHREGRGGSHEFWHKGRNSVALGFNDHIAIADFGGGEVKFGQSLESSKKTGLAHLPILSVAVSNSERFVGASGSIVPDAWYGIFDTRHNEWIMKHRYDRGLTTEPFVMFSTDGQRFLSATENLVEIWDTSSQSGLKTIESTTPIRSVSFLPDHSILVVGDNQATRFSDAGETLGKYEPQTGDIATAAGDGNTIAISSSGVVRVFDTYKENLICSIFTGESSITCIALSPSGMKLALGNANGLVSQFDVQSGEKLWTVSPPTRYRWSRQVPAYLLLAWLFVAFILWLLYENRHSSVKSEVANLEANS